MHIKQSHVGHINISVPNNGISIDSENIIRYKPINLICRLYRVYHRCSMLCYVDMVKKIHYITVACRLHGCLKLEFNILNEKGQLRKPLLLRKISNQKLNCIKIVLQETQHQLTIMHSYCLYNFETVPHKNLPSRLA